MKYWTDTSADVIYLKIMLSYEQLTKTLKYLYTKYLKTIDSSATEEDAEIRFSLAYEFQRDYQIFLNEFKDAVLDTFKSSNVEMILEDMFCIQIQNPKDVFAVLDILNKLMKKTFPALLNLTDNPIKMSISICNAKYPFFQVWKEINAQSADLQLNLIGKGDIKTTYKHLDEILLAQNANYRKSALYNLAEVAKTSEKLAEIKFNDRSERNDFYSYEALKRHLLPIGMDFQSILTFIRLLGG
jgi:hypothetical protein